jgi:hypothetical protein
MNLVNYLNFLNEERFGNPPVKPVQNPQPLRGPNQVKSKTPKQPGAPENPQEKAGPKQYFNYMVWTSKILKQGEIFRKNCYMNNCSQYGAGTGDRRICKDRCDIETCKKVIAMLRISMSKCKETQNPNACKQRYVTLIPLYQNKLNSISAKFVVNKKQQDRINVG